MVNLNPSEVGATKKQNAHEYWNIAQLVEHLTVNQGVPGSIPGGGAKLGR